VLGFGEDVGMMTGRNGDDALGVWYSVCVKKSAIDKGEERMTVFGV